MSSTNHLCDSEKEILQGDTVMNESQNSGESFYKRYCDLSDEAEENRPVDKTKSQEALKWLEKAGEQNYPDALRILAISYKYGGDFGVEIDFDKALAFVLRYEATGRRWDSNEDLPLVPDNKDRRISDDEIDWYECVEKVHPSPVLEFALARFYWELTDNRPPATSEERRALSLYEKAAAAHEPEAECDLAMYLLRIKDIHRTQEAANYFCDVVQNRNASKETVDRSLYGLLQLYSTKDSGCFDIEKAFDTALELFDGCDADEDSDAALELYWHMSLPPHNDHARFKDKWERQKRLFENDNFMPDELLLESARSIMDEIDTRITGRWWQAELAADNPQAIKAMNNAKEYLRMTKLP